MSTSTVGTLKGQFSPNSEIHVFPLTCSVIYPCTLFRSELQSFVGVLSNIMEVDALGLWWSKCQKTHTSLKLNINVSFKKSWPVTLMIHRPCCEQLHVGTFFFLFPLRKISEVTMWSEWKVSQSNACLNRNIHMCRNL